MFYIPGTEDMTINNSFSWWSLGGWCWRTDMLSTLQWVNLSISSVCRMLRWNMGCKRGPVFSLSFCCCALAILCITVKGPTVPDSDAAAKHSCYKQLQDISVPHFPIWKRGSSTSWLLSFTSFSVVIRPMKRAWWRLIIMLGVICYLAAHCPLIPFQMLVF